MASAIGKVAEIPIFPVDVLIVSAPASSARSLQRRNGIVGTEFARFEDRFDVHVAADALDRRDLIEDAIARRRRETRRD